MLMTNILVEYMLNCMASLLNATSTVYMVFYEVFNVKMFTIRHIEDESKSISTNVSLDRPRTNLNKRMNE